VHKNHIGERMLPVDLFYIRRSKFGGFVPYPTSYCRECTKKESLSRFYARKGTATDAGPTP
jgi:hypothetical protein